MSWFVLPDGGHSYHGTMLQRLSLTALVSGNRVKSDCLVPLSYPETPVETLSFPIQLSCESLERIAVLVGPVPRFSCPSPGLVQTQWVQSLHLLPDGTGADDAGPGV